VLFPIICVTEANSSTAFRLSGVCVLHSYRSVSPLWVSDRDSFRTKRLMEVLDNPVRRTLWKHCLWYERYVWGNISVPFQQMIREKRRLTFRKY